MRQKLLKNLYSMMIVLLLLVTFVTATSAQVYTSLGTPFCSVTESPTGKYLVTINLRPGVDYRKYRQVRFSITNNGSPTGFTLNIGDSISNNGWGGDASDQSNDAELHINGQTLYVYANDAGSAQLLHSASNVLPTTSYRNLQIVVEDGKATYWKNFDTSTTYTISSPYLFALKGQADTEGPVNYTIYAGINRVVDSYSTDRVGTGITDVYVYLESEIWGTPAYEPTYWNVTSVQPYNNCYNYACNKKTNTFAQPGEGGGYINPYPPTASNTSYAALVDGLEPGNKNGALPEGKSRVALVIWPNYDFHWYRQDRNGYWTHKPGSTAATNLDQSGNIITDPETANRGGYTQFVGYFFVDSDFAQGMGHENIQ